MNSFIHSRKIKKKWGIQNLIFKNTLCLFFLKNSMKHTIKEFRCSLIRVSFCKLNHFIQNHFFWSSKETILNISEQKQNLIHYIHPLISKTLNMTINFLFKHTFIERKSVPHPQNIFHIYFLTPPLIKKITNNIC